MGKRTKRPLRVGVIGCGNMGKNHIKIYSQIPEVKLVGVADINKQLVKSIAEKYNTVAYTDYRELIEKDLDIVSVVVPTTLHKKISIDALEKGINVLVEKPIAGTVKDALEIVRKAKEKNKKLLVGHIERFNPAVLKLKEIINQGILGEIASISCKRVGPFTPRNYDVGVILDLGTHDIDIISFLYNEKVKEVYAIAGSEFHSFEDHASLMLRFRNGNAGVIETNWLTPHKVRKLTVVGLEGVATLDFIEQKITLQDKFWEREAKVEYREPLYNELKHFIEVVQGEKELQFSPYESIHALEVALSAIESYKKSKVIKIKGNYE